MITDEQILKLKELGVNCHYYMDHDYDQDFQFIDFAMTAFERNGEDYVWHASISYEHELTFSIAQIDKEVPQKETSPYAYDYMKETSLSKKDIIYIDELIDDAMAFGRKIKAILPNVKIIRDTPLSLAVKTRNLEITRCLLNCGHTNDIEAQFEFVKENRRELIPVFEHYFLQREASGQDDIDASGL